LFAACKHVAAAAAAAVIRESVRWVIICGRWYYRKKVLLRSIDGA
jgi:hypothetical protein